VTQAYGRPCPTSLTSSSRHIRSLYHRLVANALSRRPNFKYASRVDCVQWSCIACLLLLDTSTPSPQARVHLRACCVLKRLLGRRLKSVTANLYGGLQGPGAEVLQRCADSMVAILTGRCTVAAQFLQLLGVGRAEDATSRLAMVLSEATAPARSSHDVRASCEVRIAWTNMRYYLCV